jgi:L-ascorbate metabolism protein UlaG (beta-lactamase superfamily)
VATALVQAVQLIHPCVAIPIHFNDYSVFLLGLDEFRASATRASLPTTKVHYLQQGDSYQFTVERGPMVTDQGEVSAGQQP